MSLGANRLASSTTWVDSAFLGSQAEESFCWALFSLPASGPAAANTAIQKTRTTHLLQPPPGIPPNRRAQLMTPPKPSHPMPSITIDRTGKQVNRNVGGTLSRPPDRAGSGRLGAFWLAGREVAFGVAQGAEGEGQGDQGHDRPDDPVDQRDAAGALDRPAADQGADRDGRPRQHPG